MNPSTRVDSCKRSSFFLPVFLCCMVYTASYLGRYSYSANITPIIDAFGASRADAGLITSFFFFSYGIGQILNGILCKYYPKRLIISVSLIVSSILNLAVYAGIPFHLYKYLWLINGICLSILWPSLVLLLSETISKENLTKSALVMSLPVPIGTFIIYGASSLFVNAGHFEYAFLLAAFTMLIATAVWIAFFPKAFSGARPVQQTAKSEPAGTKFSPALLGTILILAFFAVGCNLVKDGLGTWVPAILKENFALPDSLSILLTLLLPVVSFFSAALDAYMHKKIPSFVKLCALWYILAFVLIGLVILTVNSGPWLLVLALFGLIALFAHGINTLITSMAPLHMRDQINSGLLTGILNGCCYMGSAISSYGLGSVADKAGWSGVFWLLFAVCGVNVVLTLFTKKIKN